MYPSAVAKLSKTRCCPVHCATKPEDAGEENAFRVIFGRMLMPGRCQKIAPRLGEAAILAVSLFFNDILSMDQFGLADLPYLRLSCVHLGPSWGHPGASWGHLGASWGRLRASWGRLRASWDLLWVFLAYFGAILGFLGAILEPSWSHFGAILEPFWGESRCVSLGYFRAISCLP